MQLRPYSVLRLLFPGHGLVCGGDMGMVGAEVTADAEKSLGQMRQETRLSPVEDMQSCPTLALLKWSVAFTGYYPKSSP